MQNLATFWVVDQHEIVLREGKILQFSLFSCFGVFFDHFFDVFSRFFTFFRENAFQSTLCLERGQKSENFAFFSENLENTKKHVFSQKNVKKTGSSTHKMN